MLPPEERLVGAQLHRYIRDSLYWVLHAPRQTGKTTFLLGWMREINATENNVACYVTVEACQRVTDVNEAIRIISHNICLAAMQMGLPDPAPEKSVPETLFTDTLKRLSELVAPQSLVILFDEVDVLEGDVMIRFLRLLRGSYMTRGIGRFPVSIALVGMRDLKDYITASKDGVAPNPGSPFNIKEDSVILKNFSKDSITRLFAQRTVETGQEITSEALDYVYEQSKGQPWIVNNLFKRVTMRVLNEDSTETVTVAHLMEARRQMIQARETHLDSLIYRLENPAVRYVMQTLISGVPDPEMADSEGFRLCLDLGLVTVEQGTPQVANPIYREVLARQMTYSPQLAIPFPEWQWLLPDGNLDMDKLLKEFQKFWRRNAYIWEQKSDYSEAFPHLLLMAFLQRILNGGGRIEREYAAGRGRMDLAVEYNGKWFIIEIKLIHDYDTPQSVEEEGLEQIARYRDKIDPAAQSYLVIFDRRSKSLQLQWEERIQWKQAGNIAVLGC
jgi:hypothetical protein